MRAAAAGLGAAAVLLVAAGCGADDRVDENVDRSSRVVQECSHHVDALIEDRVVPRADRDYATEMCVQHR